MPSEQRVHDQINLTRLVGRLEKSTSDKIWDDNEEQEIWLKVQGTLQKVKYARRLLKNVEVDDDPNPRSKQRYHDIRMKLDRVEIFLRAVEKRVETTHSRPEPILPHIPLPLPQRPATVDVASPSSATAEPAQSAQIPLIPTDDLLLSPAETAQPSSNHPPIPKPFIPSNFPIPATKSTTIAAPKFLQNSNALQQELSDQLVQMAAQLKRNAQHFSETLAKDQVVVEEAQQKIEGNFDVMTKERIRLRDHRGKSGSTTCLVLVSVIVVMVSFIFMVSLIRLT